MGKRGASWQACPTGRPAWRWCCALGLVTALAGCAHQRDVEKNLMSDRAAPDRNAGVVDGYRVGCPDVLEVRVADRPDVTGLATIDLSGRIGLGHYGQPRVEGRTPAEIVRLIANQVGAAPSQVQVRVAEFNSQHLYLFGQVIGWQRAVAYQGQETVLDVLQRVGGIAAGAAPDEIGRAHV